MGKIISHLDGYVAKPRSASGLATSRKIRAAYVPKTCLCCKKPILPEDGILLVQTRKKRFCNHSCATKYNNALRPNNGGRIAKPIRCKSCGLPFLRNGNNRKLCDGCWEIYQNRAAIKTKEEAGRRLIASHAVSKMKGRRKACQRCGYSLFVDICHIRPVADFPKTAILAEVNDPANLIYFCPNCHHEFDSGLFRIDVDSH